MVLISRLFRYYGGEGLDKLPSEFLIVSEVLCRESNLDTIMMILKIYVLNKQAFNPEKFDEYIPPFFIKCNPKIMYHKLVLDLEEIKNIEFLSYKSAYNILVNEEERYLDFLKQAVVEKLGIDKIPRNMYSEVIGWDIIMVRYEEEGVLHMRIFGDYRQLLAFMDRIPRNMRDEYLYSILKPSKIYEVIYSEPEDEDDVYSFRIHLE